ncbi:hypothetical protein ACPXB3_22375 [Gordonia sp. DT219]|uniref:hypothetical protein n=1 Tax=Gordonia sp. DT219 TaxID=3416658 RepID=UPI003CF9DF33
MTESYLTRAEIDHLAHQLAKLPGLEAELAVAVTGLRRGTPVRRSVPRSKPPYSIEMQSLIDDLRNTLVAVIRDLCEQRNIDGHNIGNSIAGMGKWLHDNRFGLQLIESGEESFNDVCDVIGRCERAVSWSEFDHTVSPERVAAANRQIVTGPQVEKLARKLGDTGKGLNRKRVTYLRNRGLLKGWQDKPNEDQHPDAPSPEWKYRLGDVLDAHEKANTYPRRTRVEK